MTGYDLLKKVLNLLGYVDSDDKVTHDSGLYNRSFYIINQILADLNQGEIKGMNDEIKIPQKCAEALPYGVAMLLALVSGDNNKNHLFAEIYNSKRSAALCQKEIIDDKMPNVALGEI